MYLCKSIWGSRKPNRVGIKNTIKSFYTMKKVVLALAAIAVVACFTFTSCKKKCKCNIAGVEVEYDIDELNEKYNANIEKCTELSMPGVKCE